MTRLLKLALAGCFVATAISFVGAANAGPIEDRQTKMKTVGKSIGVVAKMAKGEAEFDAAAALQAYVDMKEAAVGFTELFPDGSGEGKTEAAPAIFSDRTGFEQAGADFAAVLETVTAAAPADLAALQASLGEVGKQCGTCHKAYRIKKN